ncbi:CACNA2D1 [Branchiostoma lanceolatum]|uniref:CACNA2D1 protein n=1 Tax=Branchiostoma lanceolatum TaxID=7740 RepID=A0A8J9V7K9_BRALA|nr:CACNA2D1 [Branchiostoma lanceolatum]
MAELVRMVVHVSFYLLLISSIFRKTCADINTFQEATDFVEEKTSRICQDFADRLQSFEVYNGTDIGRCPFSPREPVHDAFASGEILPGLGDNADYGRQISERASSVFYSEQIAAEIRPWEQETARRLSNIDDQVLQDSLCITGTLLPSWEDVYTGGLGAVRWTRYLDTRTGLSRIFPGITMPPDQSRNLSIDARLSQAYVQMFSPQKDVAIVVDITMVTHQSLMSQALSVLLQTLSPSDNVAVIINGNLQFSHLQQVTLPFPVSDLLDKIIPQDLSQEDTKSALQAGVAALWDSNACIKAVLYLTDHAVNMETVQSVLKGLSEDIQIFTYSFNPSINPRILKHLACATNGSWEPITDDVTMVTRLTRYYGMHHPLNDSAARWTSIVPDRLSAGNLSSCCCAVPHPAMRDPLQSLFGVLCVDLSVDKLQQAGATDVNILETKAAVTPRCPVQRYTKEEVEQLRPEESKCSRLDVTTGGELREFIERAVRTTAGALETAAQVVKLLPTCPFINTQYDSCTNTTPGMVPDQQYHRPVSNSTSNIHLTDQARTLYTNMSDSDPHKALVDSLCVSSSAEIDWVSVFQQNSGARWQFFIDGPTGYTRLYPSVNDPPESCQEGSGVDPRSQSWYAGMTSPAKDVAIIVDPVLDDSLDILKAAAKLAVNTISKYDTGQLMVARQQLQSDGFQQGTETNRQTWLQTVDSISSATHSTTQDLRTAIRTAFSHFKDKHQQEDTKCFPVLLLLTNRHLDLTVLHETARENTPHLGVRVFTFTFGQLADNPVAKQLACDSKGSWAMVKTIGDLHQIREYYGMLSPGEHVGNVLWSEAYNFKYDGDIRGTTGCLPVYNVSSEYLSLLGLSCVHVDEIDLQGLTDGQMMFSELTASSTKQCPTTPFDEEDVQKLRSPEAKCPARISLTATDLRGLAEQAVRQAAEEFEIGYVVAQQTPGVCPFTGEFYDTCKKLPQSFQAVLQFQREVSRRSPAFHLPYSVDVTVGEETGLQDFIDNQTLYQSLCASLGMDSTWEVTLQRSQYIAWQFYGDQTSRFLRIFPALKETQEQCSNKMSDLPIRTWFSSAASSPKDVIIVLDPHYTENLSLLKTTASALIATLTRFDFANILTTSGQQLFPGMQRAYGDVRTSMIQFVNQTEVVGDSDLTHSFVSVQGIVDRALQSSNTTHCVTAVVLITDYVIMPSVLEHLRGKAFRIFTYTVGPWADQTNGKRASCENMGAWTHVASVEDVWAKIADYYNYFSMNEKTNNVIWTEPYEDRYGLGEIVSGCLPVYDIQSEFLTLLGVTCLDLTKQRILSFPNDGEEVFNAMQSLSQRRCPASQLTEVQIEKIRKPEAKCRGHQVAGTVQGMEDSLRRGTVTAQRTFVLDGQACHGKADLAATDSCDITSTQRTNSTLILETDDRKRTANMSPGSPLYKALCVSATLIQYFVSNPSELTSHIRVYPGVAMSGEQCTDTGRHHILETVLAEIQNNVGAFLYPKTMVIILHNTRADTKSQMVQTVMDLTNTLSQWDHVNVVTSQGTVFSQTSHATEDAKDRIRSYLQDISTQDSDVVNLLHKATLLFEASTDVCNGVLFLLSDSALTGHHVAAVNHNVNATVFVKTFGGVANQDSSRTVAMEISCQHGGSWESADAPAGNYLGFFPRNIENIRDPVWFNRSHDFLTSLDSEPVMATCLPATHGSRTVGFLCSESNVHQLQDEIKVHSQCRRTELSQDQRETLRRPEAKCSHLSGKGTDAEGTTLGVTPEPPTGEASMEPGKIIAIVIGCLLIIALVAGPLLWYYKKRHNDRVDGFLRLDFLTDEIELDGDTDEVDSSTTAPLLTNQVE